MTVGQWAVIKGRYQSESSGLHHKQPLDTLIGCLLAALNKSKYPMAPILRPPALSHFACWIGPDTIRVFPKASNTAKEQICSRARPMLIFRWSTAGPVASKLKVGYVGGATRVEPWPACSIPTNRSIILWDGSKLFHHKTVGKVSVFLSCNVSINWSYSI